MATTQLDKDLMVGTRSPKATMPPRHRFLEPIHNVKERGEPLSPQGEPCEDLVFIPGNKKAGGAYRDRTDDLKLAKLALSQLS